MASVENCMIAPNSLKALEIYESIFEVKRIEVSDLGAGQSEAVFEIYGTRFHVLDENPAMMMIAPKPGDPKPNWYNVIVPVIAATYKKAMDAGCTEISPVTEIETHGVKTAMFSDEIGYIWQLHEVVREVSHEERLVSYQK